MTVRYGVNRMSNIGEQIIYKINLKPKLALPILYQFYDSSDSIILVEDCDGIQRLRTQTGPFSFDLCGQPLNQYLSHKSEWANYLQLLFDKQDIWGNKHDF